MALKIPTKEHERKTTLIFDPEDIQKKEYNFAVQRKKRVAAYARVSTELDAQQNSYEAQISYYTDYIRGKQEWEFVEVYSDEGISGTSYKKRDGFNKMVEDALAGKIDLILTKSISRFARNTVDALTITRKLKANGIEVYFEKENISSMDTQAELIFTIMSSVAQEESRSLSENVRWGKQRSMEAGNVYLPYSKFLGYKKGEDGLPEIVEEEAVTVRRIYKRYLEGASLNRIATELTEDGVKTGAGKDTWTKDGVRRILTNEKYRGDARLQKTYVVDFLTKEKRVNHGERKQWYIHDSHDAIVSPETFELVQKELVRRTGRGGRFYDSPYTGKIICGCCGAYYGHKVWHSNASCRKYVWVCSEKYKGQAVCQTPHITETDINRAFVIVVNQLIRNKPDYIDDYEKEFLPMIGDTRELDAHLQSMTSQLDELIVKIEQLVQDNARRAQNQTDYMSKFHELDTAIEEKKAAIERTKIQISDALSRRGNVQIFLEGLKKLDSLLEEFDISAWHALVDHIKVMPNKTIVFHFRNDTESSVALEEVH